MNNRLKKIIVIITIILLFGSVVILYFKWNANKGNEPDNTTINDDTTISDEDSDYYSIAFKNFIFESQ